MLPEDPLFLAFWEKYPKKRSKGDARRAWAKIAPDEALLTHMLSTIEKMRQCPDWQRDGGQYVPYPASWLNAEGWEDCPLIEKTAAPPRVVTPCSQAGCQDEAAAIWGGLCQRHYMQSKPLKLVSR